MIEDTPENIEMYEHGWNDCERYIRETLWTPEDVIQAMLDKGVVWPRTYCSMLSKYSFILSYGGHDNHPEFRHEFDSWQGLVDFVQGYRKNEILFRRFRP